MAITTATSPMTRTFFIRPPRWWCISRTALPLRAFGRWVPSQRRDLGQRDGQVERDAENTSHEDRCPGRLELEQRCRVLDLDAQLLLRAAEVLADDRADHCEHARHLECREHVRKRCRDPDAPEDGGVAG